MIIQNWIQKRTNVCDSHAVMKSKKSEKYRPNWANLEKRKKVICCVISPIYQSIDMVINVNPPFSTNIYNMFAIAFTPIQKIKQIIEIYGKYSNKRKKKRNQMARSLFALPIHFFMFDFHFILILRWNLIAFINIHCTKNWWPLCSTENDFHLKFLQRLPMELRRRNMSRHTIYCWMTIQCREEAILREMNWQRYDSLRSPAYICLTGSVIPSVN